MRNQAQALIDAFHNLMEIRRRSATDDGARFALAWLVGAKMIQENKLAEGSRPLSLAIKDTWLNADPDVGGICAEIIWAKGSIAGEVEAEAMEAIGIITRLLEIAPEYYWSVPDIPWYMPIGRSADWTAMAPEVCDLLFAMLGARAGARVWIPFDPTCQLTSRALQLGLDVESAGPNLGNNETQRLFNAVLGRFEGSNSLGNEISDLHQANKSRAINTDYLIATPPMGYRIPMGAGWRDWERIDDLMAKNMISDRDRPNQVLRLDRSDAWAPAALWPHVGQRALFLVAPSILFARGQEHRLRETWMRGHYPIELVGSLPGRMLSNTSIAAALLVFDKSAKRDQTRMADFGGLTISTGFGGRNAKTLDLEATLDHLGLQDPFLNSRRLRNSRVDPIRVQNQVPISRAVHFEEILGEGCNMQPSRYLQPKPRLQGERLPLGQFVNVIRSPVPTTDPYFEPAIEVGIPDLGEWRALEPKSPTENESARLVKIRQRRLGESVLQSGDIVMSIKGTIGTIGKTALIGKNFVVEKDKELPLVVSGNCIALRPTEPNSSKFLLVYFRSAEFKKQLELLSVGAVIPHVTPDALCDGIQIPVLSHSQHGDIADTYKQLCELEEHARSAQKRIDAIVSELWRAD